MKLEERDLSLINWALQVALDAVTIQSANGDIAKDDAMVYLSDLDSVQQKVVSMLEERRSS